MAGLEWREVSPNVQIGLDSDDPMYVAVTIFNDDGAAAHTFKTGDKWTYKNDHDHTEINHIVTELAQALKERDDRIAELEGSTRDYEADMQYERAMALVEKNLELERKRDFVGPLMVTCVTWDARPIRVNIDLTSNSPLRGDTDRIVGQRVKLVLYEEPEPEPDPATSAPGSAVPVGHPPMTGPPIFTKTPMAGPYSVLTTPEPPTAVFKWKELLDDDFTVTAGTPVSKAMSDWIRRANIDEWRRRLADPSVRRDEKIFLEGKLKEAIDAADPGPPTMGGPEWIKQRLEAYGDPPF